MLTTSWLPLVFVVILLHQVKRVSSDSETVHQTRLVEAVEGASLTPAPAPTSTTVDGDGWYSQNLYPYLSPGSVPFLSGQTGRLKKDLQTFPGRLNIRQSTCEPGYIYACPSTEPKPCCPSTHPVCCTATDVCCESGYVCAGTSANPACCLSGSVDCRNGDCCPSGTTCCGSGCCRSGYTCVSGQCVNPLLSSMSVASVASVQSVRSISSASRLSVASASSIQASISSVLVTQAGYSNSDTVTTAHVKPGDDRIKYEPTSAWFDSSGTGSSNSSPVGTCTNGTKLTTTAGAKFTFVFQGTSISLDVVPSSSGGKFTVAVDGGPATDYSSLSTNNSTSDQCITSTLVVINGLEQTAHQIVVTNGLGSSGQTGGKLEISGITYTGKGAFGTPEEKPGPSSAVIGGSVGGAIGALLLGGGILFFVYRRRRNSAANNSGNNAGAATGNAGGATGNNQMIQQAAAAPAVISPYTIPSGLPSPSGSGHQPLPYSQQFGGYPQQPLLPPQQQPQQPQYAFQQGQPGYQYGQGSTTSFAPAAPLPSWILRASQATDPGSPPNRPADAASMTSATHSQTHMPYGGMANSVNNEPARPPNAFYGAHYAPNAQGY